MPVPTSVTLLKPVRLNLRIMGLYPPENHRRAYNIYSFAIFLMLGISSLSMILYLVFTTNLKEFIKSLPIQVVLVGANWKSLTIRKNADKLSEIEDYVTHLDNTLQVPNRKERMEDALKASLKVFCVFFVIYWGFIISGAIGSYTHQELWVESWFPFNITSSDKIFLAIRTYQNVVIGMQVSRNMACDAFCPIYLILLTCQFDLFVARVKRLGTAAEKGSQENLAELIECFKVHKVLMKIFSHLDCIISQIMFTSFLITAMVFACQVVQCWLFDLTIEEKAGVAMFLIGVPLELAPCCYYGNIFMEQTDQMVNVIYNVNWYNQSPEFRKLVLIFMEMNQRKKLILAGNLKAVNLAACMDVFKFTYTLITFVLRMSN